MFNKFFDWLNDDGRFFIMGVMILAAFLPKILLVFLLLFLVWLYFAWGEYNKKS